MIAYIKGEIVQITEQAVIVENGNIGYRVFMPSSAMQGILRVGDQVTIHTYLNVKEDAMQLYGFLTADDVDIFRMLLNVSGIGPKAAIGILSALSADELRFAILSDDAKAISMAPGIGRKTAQKLILELKDKISLEDAFETKSAHVAAAGGEDTITGDVRREAVQALVALGYSNSEAMHALSAVTVEPDASVEDILKSALKEMM